MAVAGKEVGPWSLPTREVWIEIGLKDVTKGITNVTSYAGSVD